MHILVVSYDYPTSRTIDYMFTDQLCKAFVRKGHKVTVIAPQSLTKCLFRRVPISKREEIILSDGDNTLKLLRPKYLSAGVCDGILKSLIGKSYSRAISRAFKTIKEPIDFCVGEFWDAASQCFRKERE